jgi:hypothetical protein
MVTGYKCDIFNLSFVVRRPHHTHRQQYCCLLMSELRKLREASGLARIVLADRAGVSRFRLWEAENNLRSLTPEEKSAIDKVLGPALAAMVRMAAEYQRRRVV